MYVCVYVCVYVYIYIYIYVYLFNIYIYISCDYVISLVLASFSHALQLLKDRVWPQATSETKASYN